MTTTAPAPAPAPDNGFLRDARRRLRLTQAELARALGTTETTIARWERGQTIRHPRILALALRSITQPDVARAVPGLDIPRGCTDDADVTVDR